MFLNPIYIKLNSKSEKLYNLETGFYLKFKKLLFNFYKNFFNNLSVDDNTGIFTRE